METDVDDFESQYAEELEMMKEENGECRLYLYGRFLALPPLSIPLLPYHAGAVMGPPSRRALDLRSPCLPSRKRPLLESPLPMVTSDPESTPGTTYTCTAT